MKEAAKRRDEWMAWRTKQDQRGEGKSRWGVYYWGERMGKDLNMRVSIESVIVLCRAWYTWSGLKFYRGRN